jgi:hypothetical protein
MSEPAHAGPSVDGPTPSDAFALLARWNYTLTAFYLRRWRRQLELPLRLAGSASPGDFVEARRAFEEDLLADYRDQAVALHHACGEALPPDAGRGYGAELLKAQDHARQLLDQAKAQADRIIASAQARAEEIVAAAGPRSGRSARG